MSTAGVIDQQDGMKARDGIIGGCFSGSAAGAQSEYHVLGRFHVWECIWIAADIEQPSGYPGGLPIKIEPDPERSSASPSTIQANRGACR